MTSHKLKRKLNTRSSATETKQSKQNEHKKDDDVDDDDDDHHHHYNNINNSYNNNINNKNTTTTTTTTTSNNSNNSSSNKPTLNEHQRSSQVVLKPHGCGPSLTPQDIKHGTVQYWSRSQSHLSIRTTSRIHFHGPRDSAVCLTGEDSMVWKHEVML